MSETAEAAGPVCHPTGEHMARMILFSFLVTFIASRVMVFLIMARKVPDLYLHLGGSHIHHLNYGIFLITGVGGYLLFRDPAGRALKLCALLYGIGLALTFDEFGMWVRLGGTYWQRESLDAVGVLAALLGLLAAAPELKKFRPHHWWSAALLVIIVPLFFVAMVNSFHYAHKIAEPKLQEIEANQPP